MEEKMLVLLLKYNESICKSNENLKNPSVMSIKISYYLTFTEDISEACSECCCKREHRDSMIIDLLDMKGRHHREMKIFARQVIVFLFPKIKYSIGQ